MTIDIAGRAVTLDVKAADFALKIRNVLGIEANERLEDSDDGGTIFHVITLAKGRVFIEVDDAGKVLALMAKGTGLGDKLKSALYNARVELAAQASHRVGDEFIVDFRSGPDGNQATTSLQVLMDRLLPLMPPPRICTFGFRSYRPGRAKKLSASGALSYSGSFRGYLEV